MRMALTKYDPAFTAQLAPLLAGGAWVDLGRAAHKAKGTLSYLCAHTAKARAYTLEKAAKALAAADAPTDEPTRAKMRDATADSASSSSRRSASAPPSSRCSRRFPRPDPMAAPPRPPDF